MDARFCMERLWYIEGVRVLTPNLRCAHRQQFQVSGLRTCTLADPDARSLTAYPYAYYWLS